MDGFTNFLLGSGAAITGATNFLCFKHISKTFDVSKSLYYILAADALTTSILCLISSWAHFYLSFVPNEAGIFSCSISLVALYPFGLQNLLCFLVSLIR